MSKMGKFETADVLRVSFDGDLCMETVGRARPICLPYTQARSFDFRIEELKLGGEFKKHAKYLGPFPWLLFWVGRFVQGRFNQ